jgi:formimidoylglutamate deiminase
MLPVIEPMVEPLRCLHAKRALLSEGWAADVTIGYDAAGMIVAVERAATPRAGDEIAAGPVLPAMPNLHSHAFQRAMAGLAEVAGAGDDSFWTWREAMYRLVGDLTPEDVEAIAARLYVDLMKSGYGSIAEFHYLHHAADGRPHADPTEMAQRILAAAATSGIGMTLLPVFYAHGNFGGAEATPGQRRFQHDIDGFLRLLGGVTGLCGDVGATLGLAFHSLRAATPAQMREILAAAPGSLPIHIHVAEQQREVDDCLAFSGRRPIDFLLDAMPVDDRWCLIHATHAQPPELARLVATGAVVGLCPVTEANLGDGLFPATRYRGHGGCFGIGSDSHVSVSVAEELRWLEYGQRLRDERRIRLAAGPRRSTGGDLYRAALAGGAQALGQPLGAIAEGMTASFVVLDEAEPFIATAKGDQILDRWLFGLGDRVVRDVMVAGQWRIRDGHHAREEAIDRAFGAAIERLAWL